MPWVGYQGYAHGEQGYMGKMCWFCETLVFWSCCTSYSSTRKVVSNSKVAKYNQGDIPLVLALSKSGNIIFEPHVYYLNTFLGTQSCGNFCYVS
jgi:hypothetical protein